MPKAVDALAHVIRQRTPGDPDVVLANIDKAVEDSMAAIGMKRIPNVVSHPAGLTSGMWRSVMEVLDVAILAAGLPSNQGWSLQITALIHEVTQWYWLVSDPCHRAARDAHLTYLTQTMRHRFSNVQEDYADSGLHCACPKLHRTRHIQTSMDLYGPYDLLTAEMGEAAHKQFKKMFRRYVYVCPRASMCVRACVRVCMWLTQQQTF